MQIPSKLNFPRAREVAYLDTAAEGLPPDQACDALAQYYRDKASAGKQFASGIVSFEHSDAEALGAALEKKGVIVWAGDGRMRASVHLYNDEEDIGRLFGALEILTSREKLRVAE